MRAPPLLLPLLLLLAASASSPSPPAASAAPPPCLVVGGAQVSVFSFDGAAGGVPQFLGSSATACGANPGFLAFSTTTPGIVYSTSQNELPPPVGDGDNEPGITTARVSCAGGAGGGAAFANLSHVATDDPCHVAIHPSGKWVFSAAYGAGTIAWMPVKPDGTLGLARQMAVGDKAHAVNFDATGAFVFVPCLGVNYVAQLTFDAASGALDWNSVAPTAALPNASGPRHMVLHPTLPSLAFVLCELTSVVVPFALNASTGVLTQVGAPLSTIRAGLPSPTVQAAAEILASADGRFLYVTNRASPLGRGDNSIAVIPLSPEGAMTGSVVQWATGEGVGALSFPRHAVLTSAPGQPYLLTASQSSGVITVFERDQTSGLVFQTASKNAQNEQPIFIGELFA